MKTDHIRKKSLKLFMGLAITSLLLVSCGKKDETSTESISKNEEQANVQAPKKSTSKTEQEKESEETTTSTIKNQTSTSKSKVSWPVKETQPTTSWTRPSTSITNGPTVPVFKQPLTNQDWKIYQIRIDDMMLAGSGSINFKNDGTFHGSTGCNMMRGKYSINKQKININVISVTKKYCKDKSLFETHLLAQLNSVSNFSIEGNELTLSTALVKSPYDFHSQNWIKAKSGISYKK